MKIHSLLNPLQSSAEVSEPEESHKVTKPLSFERGLPRVSPMSKKQRSGTPREIIPVGNTTQPPRSVQTVNQLEKYSKPRKDAPHFRKGPTVGAINYPPHATNNPFLVQKLAEFRTFPANGKIQEYVDHVPYSSERRTFHETGRTAFEVFQYEFIIPGDQRQGEQPKAYHVMWDYNVGLVRMTSFFKACKYPKTTPARVLSVNPGMREITHSITGGALRAQGYWMPFDAAKEVAATFCWNIRYALVPIFGSSFPESCIRPNVEGYESFIISPNTIQKCQNEANNWREKAQSNVGVESSVSQQLPSGLSGLSKHKSIVKAPNGNPNETIQEIVQHDSLITEIGLNKPVGDPIGSMFTPINLGFGSQTVKDNTFEQSKLISNSTSISLNCSPSTPIQSPKPLGHGMRKAQHQIQYTNTPRSSPQVVRTPTQQPIPEYRTRSQTPYTPVPSYFIPVPSPFNTPAGSLTKTKGILSPFAHVSCCGHLGCHTPCKITGPTAVRQLQSYSSPQYYHQKPNFGTNPEIKETGANGETLEAAGILLSLSVSPEARNCSSTGLTLEEQQRRQLPIPMALQQNMQYGQQSPEHAMLVPSPPEAPLALFASAILTQEHHSMSPVETVSAISTQRPNSPFGRVPLTLPSIEEVISSRELGTSQALRGKRPAQGSVGFHLAKKSRTLHYGTGNHEDRHERNNNDTELSTPNSEDDEEVESCVTEDGDYKPDAEEEHEEDLKS